MATTTTGHKILDNSCMGFKLPDGKVLLISEADIQQIADRLVMEILVKGQHHVYMISDSGLQRAKELYIVYKSEKDQMTEKQKHACLATIIKLLSENNYELTTLDELIKAGKSIKPQ